MQYDHPDLAGKVIRGDHVDNDWDPYDGNGHGTHTAGIAAAVTNNARGIAGMAPEATIYAVRVLDESGSGTLQNVANGIIHAADNGADVINLSLGSPNDSITLKEAVDYAWNKGVVVVAAAGNDGSAQPTYPAYYSDAIAVAATDSDESKASFSNYGNWVDVAAPGVNIYSTYTDGGYASLSGTSMATPHVAGLAGLLDAQGRQRFGNPGGHRKHRRPDFRNGHHLGQGDQTPSGWSTIKGDEKKAEGGRLSPSRFLTYLPLLRRLPPHPLRRIIVPMVRPARNFQLLGFLHTRKKSVFLIQRISPLFHKKPFSSLNLQIPLFPRTMRAE